MALLEGRWVAGCVFVGLSYVLECVVMYVCAFVRAYACMCVWALTRMCVCVRVCVCTCVHTCSFALYHINSKSVSPNVFNGRVQETTVILTTP